MNKCWEYLLANARNALTYLEGSMHIHESLGAAIAECEADLRNRQTEVCVFCATERVAAPGNRAHGWQPIETAKKDGSHFLSVIPGLLVAVCHWDLEYSKWATMDAEDFSDDMAWEEYCQEMEYHPTHWMPLPAAPKATCPQCASETPCNVPFCEFPKSEPNTQVADPLRSIVNNFATFPRPK